VPKVVDHQERRIKLIEATWRTIVRDGWDAATMSAIATEAGFATGPCAYFSTKEDLPSAAFDHI
jgi:DNA-binding transcriptional regulator YbjK